MLAIGVLSASMASAAPPRDLRAERQQSLNANLSAALPQAIARGRASCAMGEQPTNTIRLRSVGFADEPDAADVCVTILTRLGREGSLGYVRDPRSSTVQPALAFDQGFVAAWRNRESTVGLPTMAALKPTAERCLAQAEKDTDLCHSVGYAYGTRAANGELVVVQ